jgi:transposase InsO family protein
VQISERTLRHWRSTTRPAIRRGRLPLATSVDERNEILRFIHRVSGPAIGVPALRALFPAVPRCVLEDLQRRYRRVWRRRYRRRGWRLIWHRPGRVWAMDHSQATYRVDGVYRQIFAVRDLASHRQLAWVPVRSTGADEIRPILAALFAEHGATLVIKSDNGSAFQAAETRGWLADQKVLPLFSPAAYPQYNGQLERSNASNKIYTHQRAVAEGHPQHWLRSNLEQACQLANTVSRPWGHRGPTADEAWDARPATTDQEREEFFEEVEHQRREARWKLNQDTPAGLPAPDRDEIDRRAIQAVLESRGYLTKQQQSRPPKSRSRPPRASLERALRQQREAGRRGLMDESSPVASPMTPTEELVPVFLPPVTSRVTSTTDSFDAATLLSLVSTIHRASDAMPPARDSVGTEMSGNVAPSESSAEMLAMSRRGDIMRLVVADSPSCCNIRPPPRAAQREQPHSTWWRSPITLLVRLAKAAKIMR